MNTFLISFTLNNDNDDYARITELIRNASMWARVLRNTWIIKSMDTASEIRSRLSNAIEGEGQIIVIKVTNAGWASYDINQDVTDWMKKNV